MFCVADIMSINPITLRPNDSLKTAKEMMHNERIRHLPVITSKGEMVGILSQRNLLQATVSFFADIPDSERDQIETAISVSEVMVTD
ncbi:CBS domain-containing protein, partial [Desulfovibrio sp. OttesenSCG-928-G15]|nr:CBS domain-containing protein [Desulfovibrio sp. OttesenSCG-928-G15]